MSRRVDLAAAASVLGLSQAATKKRLQRGSLAGGKDEAGRWYAELEDPLGFAQCENEEVVTPTPSAKEDNGHADGRGDTGIPPASQRDDTLIDALQGEVLYLRAELTAMREQRDEDRRRHDTIIAQLTSRPLELAPPVSTLSETDNALRPAAPPVSTLSETDNALTPASVQTSRRPWWRHLFRR